jgi:hypothetical protein
MTLLPVINTKTKTAHIASQWFPTASIERLRPVCRFMLWTLYNDDICEEATPFRSKTRTRPIYCNIEW